MKTLVLLVIVLTAAILPSPAQAEGLSCMTTASDKKLTGAVKTSFTKKCISDAVGS